MAQVILVAGDDDMAQANDIVGRVYQNLVDAGCDKETTDKCMLIVQKGSYSEMLPILAQHKAFLLDGVHVGQKQIDCLDYLIYNIQKGLG